MIYCTKIEILNVPDWVGPEYLTDGKLLLDLLDKDQSIPQNIKTEELTVFNKIQVNEVLGIDLPKSAVNDLVLRNIVHPNTFRRKNGIQVRAWQGSTPLIQNRLFVISYSNSYQVEIRLGNEHWAIASQRLKLKDLVLGEWEFSKANIEDIQINNAKYLDGDLGIYFPLANFGKTHRENRISPEDYRIFHHILPILKAGFCAMGFVFRSPIFESDFWRHAGAYLLSKTYGPTNERQFNVALAEDYELSVPANPNVFTIVGERVQFDEIIFDPQNQYSATEYEFSGNSYCRFTTQFNCELSAGSAPNDAFVTVTFSIRSRRGNNETIIGGFVRQFDLPLSSNPLQFTATIITDVFSVTTEQTIFVDVVVTNQRSIENLVLTIKQGSSFYNTPVANLYYEGDIIDLAKIIHPDYTFDQIFKGVLQPISGLIETDWITRTVTAYPPDTVDVHGEQVEGFFQKEYIDIQEFVSPGSIKSTTEDIEINRFIYLKFKKSSDPSITELELSEDEELFSRRIDLGDKYKDETTPQENPFFEPTINKQYRGIGEQTIGPSVPHLLDNANGELSFDLKPRLVYFHGRTFMRNIDANRLAAFTYEGNYIANIPLAYQSLDDFEEQISGPTDLYPFDRKLVYGYDDNDFYNLHWKNRIQDLFNNLKLEFLVDLDLNRIDLFSLRKRYAFIYEDMQINALIHEVRDFKGCQDILTPVVFIPKNTGNIPCADEDNEVLPDLGCFENTRRIILLVDFANDCYSFEVQAFTEFTIVEIIPEWRYIDETDWTFGNVICNPTGQFVIRAIIKFDNGCPDVILTRVIEPCLKSGISLVFNYNFLSACLTIQVNTDIPAPIIDEIVIETSIDNKVTWQAYTPPICDYNGEICARATVTFLNGCPPIVIEECFQTPPQQPEPSACNDLDYSVECTAGTTGIIPVRTLGGQVPPEYILFDLIQYRYSSEDYPLFWDEETELDCPVEIRRVIIFCNNYCEPYCGPWVPCSCDPCADEPGTPANVTMCNNGDCSLPLRSRMVGSSPGGTWTFDGYSLTPGGTPGAGGTDISGILTGDNPIITPFGWTQGFYHITYTIDQPGCDPQSQTLIVQILPFFACSGLVNQEENYCEGETGSINLYTIFGQTQGAYCEINDIQSTGTDTIDGADIGASIVDLTGYAAGTYQLTIVFAAASSFGVAGEPQYEEYCTGCIKEVTLDIIIEDCQVDCDLNPGDPENKTICN